MIIEATATEGLPTLLWKQLYPRPGKGRGYRHVYTERLAHTARCEPAEPSGQDRHFLESREGGGGGLTATHSWIIC